MTGIAANQSVGVPRQSMLQQLTAPGVTPVYVSDSSQKLSQWFGGLFQGIAGTAGQLAQIHEQRRNKIEEENRKYFAEQGQRGMLGLPIDPLAGEEARKHYDLQSGFRWAKIVADKTEQDITNGKFNIGADEDIASAVTRISMEESGNRSETFRAAFNTAFREQASPMLIRAQKRFKEETYESMASVTPTALTSSAEAGLLTEERATQIIQGADAQGKAFGKTPAQVIERAVMPAAEAIARRGDITSLGVLLPHIAKHAPEKAEQLRAMADSTRRQNDALRRDDAMKAVAEIEQAGPSVDGFKVAVENLKASKTISDYEAVALTDRYTQKRVQLAASTGNVGEVDAMAKHFSNDPDAQLVFKNYREQAVQTSRKMTADRIVAGVGSGSLSPDDAARNIMGRLERWKKNPEDHLGLPPDMALSAIAKTEREAKGISEREIRTAQMAFAMQPGNEGKILASAEDDDALIIAFAGLGLADAPIAPNGSPIFRGMVKPEAAARQAASVGRVPKQWQDSIVSAFNGSTADSQGLQQAMRSYAAIALRNPSLAAQMDRSMSDTGRVRAVTLMNEINRQHTLQVNPETGDPNPDWIKRITDLTPTVLNAKPINMTDSDLTNTMWGVKTEAEARDFSTKDLSMVLPESMQKSSFLLWTTQDLHISPDVGNDYVELAREAFKDQIGAGVPQQKAIENAKRLAGDRLLAKHPPVVWNGVVTVGGEAPHAFSPELEVAMLNDLAKAIPESQMSDAWSEKTAIGRLARSTTKASNVARYTILASDVPGYITQTRPKWDPTFKHSGGVGAWTLIDPNGQPLVINNQVFAFVPEPKETETVKQMRKRFEEKARARREAAVEGMNSPDRAILEAMFTH